MSALPDENLDKLGLPAEPDEVSEAATSPKGGFLMREEAAEPEPEKKAETQPETAPTTPAAEVAPPPPITVPQMQAPVPEYLMPFMQQQAQTNQALQQIAGMYQQQMMQLNAPPPEPEPDPIEDPKKFHEYMSKKQFGPILQQIDDINQKQMFFHAESLRREVENSDPAFRQITPAVIQMAARAPLHELAKPGTWEVLYNTAENYIRKNMPHLLGDQAQPQAKPAAPAVQRFPEAKQPPPTTPSGTMGGAPKQRMSEKFIRECKRLGNKPEDVLAFAIKDGQDIDELMK